MSDSSRVPDRVKHEIPTSVAIVGIGGVGSWLSLFISEFENVERIALFDSDVIEKSNLERTPFKISQLGDNKAVAMKQLIKERREDVVVRTYGNLYESNKRLLNMYKLRVVCADGVAVRNMVLKFDNSIASAYDVDEEKDHITVHEEGGIFSVDDEDGGNYTIQPSWSVPAVLVAILTLYQIGQDTRPIDMSARVKELFTRGVNGKLKFHLDPQDNSIAEEEVGIESIF